MVWGASSKMINCFLFDEIEFIMDSPVLIETLLSALLIKTKVGWVTLLSCF